MRCIFQVSHCIVAHSEDIDFEVPVHRNWFRVVWYNLGPLSKQYGAESAKNGKIDKTRDMYI